VLPTSHVSNAKQVAEGCNGTSINRNKCVAVTLTIFFLLGIVRVWQLPVLNFYSDFNSRYEGKHIYPDIGTNNTLSIVDFICSGLGHRSYLYDQG
jgi:hypothetical protein